jgi:hypothetical protein
MGVYVSLSPATRQNLTLGGILKKLQAAGFSITGHGPDECAQDHEIDPEAPHATLFEMWDDESNLVEVEINHNFPSHFCVWWRYSWSIGALTYARELSHLLDLADRLGWELHGNTAKTVTRETLSDEVERLTGDATAVKRMLGVQSAAPSEVHVPKLSEEAAYKIDAMILEMLERMAEKCANGSKPDES